MTSFPRLMIAAAHKASGKTAISIGFVAALRRAGNTVATFKKGPDYIDPMWLGAASGFYYPDDLEAFQIAGGYSVYMRHAARIWCEWPAGRGACGEHAGRFLPLAKYGALSLGAAISGFYCALQTCLKRKSPHVWRAFGLIGGMLSCA